MDKRTILIICSIVYFIIIFSTEILYRQKLYDFSVEYIENIKQNVFFDYFNYFWSIIMPACIVIAGLTISFLYFPINVAFSQLSIQLSLGFIMYSLKSIYCQSRPFWDIYLKKEEEKPETRLPDPIECENGFGNPSGHALSSTYLLCLWDLLLNSQFFNKMEGKKKNILLNI